MRLMVQDLSDGTIKDFQLNSQEDFTELFKIYPHAYNIAFSNGTDFKQAAEAIAKYLSNFNTKSWVEGLNDYIRPNISFNKEEEEEDFNDPEVMKKYNIVVAGPDDPDYYTDKDGDSDAVEAKLGDGSEEQRDAFWSFQHSRRKGE